VDGDSNVAVAKVTNGHGVDTGFGPFANGTTNYAYGSTRDFGEDVVIEPGGKIDVAASGGFIGDMALSRLRADGTLDRTLNGTTTTSADFGGDDSASAVALQANGKMLMAGSADGQQFAVARFQPGGPLDGTFGTGGKATVSFPGGNAGAAGMAVAPDGKIVLAGDAGNSVAVVRLDGDSAAAGGGPAPGTPGGGTGTGGKGGTTKSTVPRCGGKAATIVGTSHKDVLKGTRRADVIVGLGGNDRISGLGGNDIVCGGSGNDTISGGTGNDRILGDTGNDHLHGDSGNDRLEGAGGNDGLDGGTGNDRLAGQSGKDTMLGGTGNDHLDGGSGNDRLSGQSGKDILLGGTGDDHLDGGSGDDRLSGQSGKDHLTGGPGKDALNGGPGKDTQHQ
jgi:Ca2+-binding RTX toxin-like protein